MSLSGEMTFEDLLNDPLTLSVMKADHVDPAALRADLRLAARRLAIHEAPALAPREATDMRAFRSLLGNCIQARRSAGDASMQWRWSSPRI
jgi:hypothetical protein